jgi:diguanylate cyclase (GGDEF)-like protein
MARKRLLAVRTALRDAARALGSSDIAPPADEANWDLFLSVVAEADQLTRTLLCALVGERLAADAPAARRAAVRVVAVDDDPTMHELLPELLQPEFEVVCCRDPRDVPRLVEEQQPEVVLTDLHMPELDGLSLIQRLQGDPRTAQVTCVLMSGDATPAEQLRAFSSGAGDCVRKPLDRAELVARLERAAERTRQQRQHRSVQACDDLTGLPNRYAFSQALAQAVRGAVGRAEPLALAVLDVEGLQGINERHGRASGDLALMAVGQALQASRGEGDCVARLGGGEFALLMPHRDLLGASRVLRQLGERLQAGALLFPDGTEWVVPVRIGLAGYDGASGLGPRELLTEAEAALAAARCRRRPAAPG